MSEESTKFSIVLDTIAENIRLAIGGRKTFHVENGAYSYAQSPTETFHFIVSPAFRYLCDQKGNDSQLTFLDAGCGPGLTLQLARFIGFEFAIGLEMDDRMIKLAKIINCTELSKENRRHIFKASTCVRIIKTDIRTSRMYRKADVVFFFVPMGIKNQPVFMRHVMNATRPGTIIIAYGGSDTLKNSKKFENILNVCTYIKKGGE